MPKYIDTPSIVQIIGAIYNDPSILDNEKYTFYEEDFPEEFHKIIFGSIYNLHALGAKDINTMTIEDYLASRPEKYAIYKTNRGTEYLQKINQFLHSAAFDYYYNRMKKMTLFRAYQNIGIDLTWLYNPDEILNVKKVETQENWLDSTSIEEIADLIDKKIFEVRTKYADNEQDSLENAGSGAIELLARLKEIPDIGVPLYGPLINTVCRGARLKKLYLRSASTGLGKTRSMIADCCYIACDELYNSETNQWEKNGVKQPTMFISTEQEKEEIQTMMIAFLSDVDEEKIINGEYDFDEWERVCYAADLLSQSPLYIQELPDFSLKDIETTIKIGIKEHNVQYICYDYLHSSMKILNEVGSRSGVKNLREDNILFMIAVKLKDICNQYGVFIITATQLNGEYRTANHYDQNLLRGAKSIADRIDTGMIMLETSQEDLVALESLLQQGGFATPQVKIAIYKNRRGRYKDILLWCSANRGTCKIKPMFATNYNYELIEMEDLKIQVQ